MLDSRLLDMKRIIIVGTSGCGKTSLGRYLSAKLNIELVELDDFYWLPNWIKRDKDEFRALLEKAADKESWIIAGNQSKFRDLFWPKADLIIWLDLPLLTLLWRVFKRGICKWISREVICNGNRQTLSQLFYLMFYWVGKSFKKRKKDYNAAIKKPMRPKWVHLKSSREVRNFVDQDYKIFL